MASSASETYLSHFLSSHSNWGLLKSFTDDKSLCLSLKGSLIGTLVQSLEAVTAQFWTHTSRKGCIRVHQSLPRAPKITNVFCSVVCWQPPNGYSSYTYYRKKDYPFHQSPCFSSRLEHMKFGSRFINIDLIVVLTSVIQSYQRWQRSQWVQAVTGQPDSVSLWFQTAEDSLSVFAMETINKRQGFLLTWRSPLGAPYFKSYLSTPSSAVGRKCFKEEINAFKWLA